MSSSGTAPRDDESRLLELDAFRAIAILAVMAHHFLNRYAPPRHFPSLYGYRDLYPQWLDLGALGVQFFFIISGFVIFMTLERCDHLLEFWGRRIARLYPAYFVATFVTFVIVNSVGPEEFHSHLVNVLVGLTFLPGYIDVSFVEPAYWSLVVELKFYLGLGHIYALTRGHFVAGGVAYCATGTVLSLLGSIPGWHILATLAHHVFLSEYAAYFTLGMAFYQVFSGWRRGWWIFALTALVEYALAGPVTTLAEHLTAAAMVLAFVGFVSGRLKFLAVRPLVFLGGISYSLYLLHQYIGVSLIPFFTRGLGLPDIAAACCVAAVCMALAYLLMRGVEVPAKRALLRWMRQHLFPSLPRRLPALSFVKNGPKRFDAEPERVAAQAGAA